MKLLADWDKGCFAYYSDELIDTQVVPVVKGMTQWGHTYGLDVISSKVDQQSSLQKTQWPTIP